MFTAVSFQSSDLRRFAAAALLSLLMPLASTAAQPSTTAAREFNLESQDAATGLRALAVQGDFQVLFPAHLVEGRRINQVRGKFTAGDALEKALRGTGLQYRATADGTFVVQKQGESSTAGANSLTFVERDGEVRTIDLRRASPEFLRLADAQAAPSTAVQPPQATEKDSKDAKADAREETVVEVTGSRIRSLLGESSFSPMVTFTRKDIERSGMSTIGELGRLIPQAYSNGSYEGIGFGGQQQGTTTTSDGSIASSTTTGRSTINMRGLGTQNTLVLVNGRRIAKTGVIRGNDANDLAGIPVSSIERIEVLTDGASAIYGSDAVGGVINIIQRKDYRGTEASVSYENTFDTDTAVTTMNLSRSFTFNRLSGSASGTFQKRNAFAAVDRYFSATDFWTTLGGTTGQASTANSFGAGGFAIGAGIVQAVSGNLPGRTTPFAVIPDGATGATALPASAYVSVAGNSLGVPAYTGDRAKYANLISPQQNKGLNLRLSYPVGERTELFLDSRYSETFTAIEGLPVNFRNSMVVPANYPGNPFGVSVRLNKTFWELDPQLQGKKDVKSDTTSAATGITGMFGKDWRYEASFDWNRSILQDTNAYDPVLQTDVYNAAIAAQSLVLFYDSRVAAPNSESLLLSMLRPGNRLDRGVTMGITTSLDGAIWELPAGALRIAMGAEGRRETAKTFQSIPENPLINLSLLGNFERDVSAAYAEMLIPLVSRKQGIPLLNSLEATAAIRYDDYSDIGGDYSPRYGLTWRPVSWLMLRGTRNHAFRAPNLQSIYRPVTNSTLNFNSNTTVVDPLRNNELLTGIIPSTIGGNPNLKPERSISTNLGVVLEVPFERFSGLSLSVDWIDFDYTDRISGLGTQDIINLFPERLTRGPSVGGLPGPIIGIDTRSFNIAQVNIESVDYQVKYSRATAFGNFDFRAAVTQYDKFDSRSLPTANPVSTSFQFPTRYTLQSYWNRGALGLGVSGFYQEKRFTTVARTVLLYQDAMEWSTQMAYDFGAAGFSGDGNWMARLLGNSKLALTIFNVLDTEPPHLQGGRGGFAVIDPRMRRYSLTLTKTF